MAVPEKVLPLFAPLLVISPTPAVSKAVDSKVRLLPVFKTVLFTAPNFSKPPIFKVSPGVLPILTPEGLLIVKFLMLLLTKRAPLIFWAGVAPFNSMVPLMAFNDPPIFVMVPEILRPPPFNIIDAAAPFM